ncbi:MAG: tRNA pseudouridine(55) synthase TruB [Bosea sp.]|uniref:tRNA pseudouridine(55) synthase TruB n=1 Tax=Bosea sp. (in: a-proteobacteria) TaxID=1871050 RepID=UPI001ACA38F6|nr:tRNA pseudouridine(55) synthase TruB [Bosea sp. (in: a-proteobacteria)]MBN9453496.1 tRNA pseudouridine(55) synthase TruB [Bosea sp. (in: a-proteobacteria)]
MTAETPSESARNQDTAPAPRPKKRDIHGWVILDKPIGMTSTHAVSVVKRAFGAKKAGHAGTLDPLASGLLPIALGEATKTVPFVMDGRKAYQFTVAWGTQTNTDDTEGSVIATSDKRPDEAAIAALLPRFTGTILQTPPKFSAIKIAGERAYDLARDGEEVELDARPVEIDALAIVSHDGATTTFEAECGKGTYVRAIARDLGLALGCLGHVAHLRRTRVGPFSVAEAASVENLRESPESALAALQPVKAALTLIPEIVLHRDAAARLKRGQSALLRGAGAPIELEAAYATCAGTLVSTGSVQNGEFVPHRVFNL